MLTEQRLLLADKEHNISQDHIVRPLSGWLNRREETMVEEGTVVRVTQVMQVRPCRRARQIARPHDWQIWDVTAHQSVPKPHFTGEKTERLAQYLVGKAALEPRNLDS